MKKKNSNIFLSYLKLWKIQKFIIATIGVNILLLFYLVIGRISGNIAVEPVFKFYFDEVIPFIPISSWYYLFGLYGVVFYAVYTIEDKKNFYYAMLSSLITAMICFCFFINAPIAYPRPDLSLAGYQSEALYSTWLFSFDNLSLPLMKFIYSVDTNINTFPSLHIGYTVLFSLVCFKESPKVGMLLAVNAFFVFISTLTTKQHYIADGIAGFLVALIASKNISLVY